MNNRHFVPPHRSCKLLNVCCISCWRILFTRMNYVAIIRNDLAVWRTHLEDVYVDSWTIIHHRSPEKEDGMSNHRVRAIISWLTTNKNVNLIKGHHTVLDKWSNCWLRPQIWLVAWRQNKETWWDHNLDCLLYLKSEPFLFIHWKRHILSHRSWRQHTCSTHANPVSASSAHGLCRGFMISPTPNVERSPLMASTRWLAQAQAQICSYASWDVLTVDWCDSSNLVGKWFCLFAFARVFDSWP